MAPTKEGMAATSGVSHQEALVKLMLSSVPNKPVKFIIPGGANLFKEGHELDSEGLQKRIYTWLRSVREFEECTLSFASSPSAYQFNLQKIVDFPANLSVPVWALPAKGKYYLSKIMADQIASATKAPILLVAKKDGLYIGVDEKGVFSPKSEDFIPYIEFRRPKRSQYDVY